MGGCRCNVGLSALGRENCVSIQSVTKRFIFTEVNNRISLSGLGSENWFQKLTAPIHERWFPSPNFEAITLPKADSKFEEAPSGRKVFIRQGKRSFTGELWAEDSHPTILKRLKSYKCVKFGVYMVDVNGNLVGEKKGNYLYPIEVDSASFDPQLMFADDNTVAKIKVQFDFALTVNEENLYMVTEVETNQNFLELSPLIEVDVTVPIWPVDGATTIGVRIKNPFIADPSNNGVLAQEDNITLLNISTGAAIVPSLAVDNGGGDYTLTVGGSDLVEGQEIEVRLTSSDFSGVTTFTVQA